MSAAGSKVKVPARKMTISSAALKSPSPLTSISNQRPSPASAVPFAFASSWIAAMLFLKVLVVLPKAPEVTVDEVKNRPLPLPMNSRRSVAPPSAATSSPPPTAPSAPRLALLTSPSILIVEVTAPAPSVATVVAGFTVSICGHPAGPFISCLESVRNGNTVAHDFACGRDGMQGLGEVETVSSCTTSKGTDRVISPPPCRWYCRRHLLPS